MAISVKHKFVSAKVDGTDSTLIQPSNWNDFHDITLAAGKVMGRDSSGSGLVQELPIAVDSTQQSMIPPSGTTVQRPASPAAGMMRYNTTTNKFEGYTSSWGTLGGGAFISDTAPSSPVAGDLWWKSSDGQMYIYYDDGTSTQWVIANYFTGAGAFLPLTGGTVTGNVIVTGAGMLGYDTGSGGTVTQATSKSTGVTINKTNGTITMNSAALAASVNVSFTVTNSTVAATDTIIVNTKAGSYAAAGTYRVQAEAVNAGNFIITVSNQSGGSLSEALQINFSVIKAVNA